MPLLYALFILIFFSGCSRTPSDQSDQIISLQVIDRNGFTETISNKDRLASYQSVDFTHPQPYQKVLRVYGKNTTGQSLSKISSYHPNGHIWQLLEVVDGRAHGLYQEWHANGRMRIECHVIEGLADINDLALTSWVFDGTSSVWNEQCALIAEIYYDKGLLHTPSIYYHTNGQIAQTIPYTQGNIEGTSTSYDEQGNITELVSYVQGQKQGACHGYWSLEQICYEELYDKDLLLTAAYYYLSGRKISEIIEGRGMQSHFKNGILSQRIEFQKGLPQGLVEEFRPDGSLHLAYHVLNEKKHGEEWEYYPPASGEELKPKLCLHWQDDQIQGQVKTWYENGVLESQREIQNHKKQGLSFAWYKNGDIMLVEDYANDLLIKASYFKKGDKKPVSKIEDGKGVATLFTSDGIFLKKISYEKGKPLLHDEPLR